jgi:hypothetical protein
MRGLFRGGVPTFFQRLSFGWYMWGYEGARRLLRGNDPKQEVRDCEPLIGFSLGSTVLFKHEVACTYVIEMW